MVVNSYLNAMKLAADLPATELRGIVCMYVCMYVYECMYVTFTEQWNESEVCINVCMVK